MSLKNTRILVAGILFIIMIVAYHSLPPYILGGIGLAILIIFPCLRSNSNNNSDSIDTKPQEPQNRVIHTTEIIHRKYVYDDEKLKVSGGNREKGKLSGKIMGIYLN